MSFQIDFLGLVYFHHVPNGRWVLLPDGRTPEEGIAPHFASFFLERAKVVDDSQWWRHCPDRKALTDVCLREYPICEPSTITISGLEAPAEHGCRLWNRSAIKSLRENKLVHLRRDCDKDIRVNPDTAETIAKLFVGCGEIATFVMAGGATVTRLRVPHGDLGGGVQIVATTSSGKTMELDVVEETEIILSNTSDLVPTDEEYELQLRNRANFVTRNRSGVSPRRESAATDGYDDQHSHFRIYANLGTPPHPEKLKVPHDPPPDLPPFLSSHPYLLLLDGEQVPGADCGNTCCG
ncbi:MAG TPA: hypothetical protein VHT23_12025 [Gemmatimonadaceae bacterium]|jgi:hypothetical protein|nr:hypothetical protein [Gemmatimonadaceae bacterium]